MVASTEASRLAIQTSIANFPVWSPKQTGARGKRMICVRTSSIALELFGTDRMMFGSDYPVCLLAASYDRVLGSFQELLRESRRQRSR